MYDIKTILDYVEEEDVKFIRLAFVDVFGNQKNISVMPHELERVFKYGVNIDGAAIKGFGGGIKSDLIIHPDTNTISRLPWRPSQGRVIRMFCNVKNPDDSYFECDTRKLLIDAVAEAKKQGLEFYFGSEIEFYLFKTDEFGEPTNNPYDKAGYMDIAPEDKGENVRREICLTLEEMGIIPSGSHHEEGPGQNEIDFRYSDALKAADDATTFKSVVRTIAARNGLYASFNPKPLADEPGNGYHINMSVKSKNNEYLLNYAIEGILSHSREMTAFLNISNDSYKRLGKMMAPKYVSWSSENRSELIRIPAAKDEYRRIELRQADPMVNPYLAFALLIYAALDGINSKKQLRDAVNYNLYTAPKDVIDKLELLPTTLDEAKKVASKSEFIKKYINEKLLDSYLK